MKKKSKKVPKEMQDVYLSITKITDEFSQQYLNDGSVADACPPLQALLHIMATGHYQGKDVHDPEIRILDEPIVRDHHGGRINHLSRCDQSHIP